MKPGGDSVWPGPTGGERTRLSRMIGRWPEGVRFEDAAVPREALFRGSGRDAGSGWPGSSLAVEARIARRR